MVTVAAPWTGRSRPSLGPLPSQPLPAGVRTTFPSRNATRPEEVTPGA